MHFKRELLSGLCCLFLLNCTSCKQPNNSDDRHSGNPPQVGVLLKRVPPQYPAVARAAHVQGTVVLRAIIAEDGTVASLEAVSGPELLRGAAIDAVKQWVYRPYILNGQPRRVDTQIEVNFNFAPTGQK